MGALLPRGVNRWESVLMGNHQMSVTVDLVSYSVSWERNPPVFHLLECVYICRGDGCGRGGCEKVALYTSTWLPGSWYLWLLGLWVVLCLWLASYCLSPPPSTPSAGLDFSFLWSAELQHVHTLSSFQNVVKFFCQLMSSVVFLLFLWIYTF